MTAARFHNALRIMRSLDAGEMITAGVIDENWGTSAASPRDQLGAFFNDPYTEALKMPDANFERLWVLIESRQPKKETTDA